MKITEAAGKITGEDITDSVWILLHQEERRHFEDVIEKLQVNPRHRKEKEALICSAN